MLQRKAAHYLFICGDIAYIPATPVKNNHPFPYIATDTGTVLAAEII
jgi:hypothetical protein